MRNLTRVRFAIALLDDMEDDGYGNKEWLEESKVMLNNWGAVLNGQAKRLENED